MSYRAKTYEDALMAIKEDIEKSLFSAPGVTNTNDDLVRRDLVERIRDRATEALRRD